MKLSKRDLEMVEKGYTKVELSVWIKSEYLDDFLRKVQLLAHRLNTKTKPLDNFFKKEGGENGET